MIALVADDEEYSGILVIVFFIFELYFNIISFNLGPGIPYNVLDSLYNLEAPKPLKSAVLFCELNFDALDYEAYERIEVSMKLL